MLLEYFHLWWLTLHVNLTELKGVQIARNASFLGVGESAAGRQQHVSRWSECMTCIVVAGQLPLCWGPGRTNRRGSLNSLSGILSESEHTPHTFREQHSRVSDIQTQSWNMVCCHLVSYDQTALYHVLSWFSSLYMVDVRISLLP